MINVFTYECDFLHYKKIHNTFANKCCIFKDQMVWNPSLFIFLVINSYITFIESKNLIKNLFSLNCQELPQNTYKNVFCQNSKNVRVLTRGLLLYDCVLFFVKRVLVGWVRGECGNPNSSLLPKFQSHSLSLFMTPSPIDANLNFRILVPIPPLQISLGNRRLLRACHGK